MMGHCPAGVATGFPRNDARSAIGALFASLGMGHRIRRRRFNDADLAVDCAGKVAVVTGGSSGLGLAAARRLAERGATVILVSRDAARAEAARVEVERGARGEVHTELADLASLSSVRALAGRIAAKFKAISVLIHNAGVLSDRFSLSEDGVETTFATNALGPFLLTALLLPELSRAAPARVVYVSSTLMLGQRLDADAVLRPDPRAHRPLFAYMASKRAQVALCEVWAARLLELNAGITSNCMLPGVAWTPGAAQAFPRLVRLAAPLLRTADEGADTMVWLAVARAVERETGKLWFDREELSAHAVPSTRGAPGEAARLFEACEALCGISVLANPRALERTTEVLNVV